MTNLFPDESIPTIELEEKQYNWQIYFDGLVNLHGSGIGSILISPTGVDFVAIKLRFRCTNNTTEWEACITGLDVVIDMNIKDLEVYGDSILIIR